MNEDVKVLWIDDLLHGGHAQGRKQLRSRGDLWCCLGRLSDLAAQAGVGRWELSGEGWMFVDTGYSHDNDRHCSEAGLTPGVARWAGLPTNGSCFVRVGEDAQDGTGGTLASLNDTGATFEDIAEIVKDKL